MSLQGFAPWLIGRSAGLPGAARFALETALLDLVGRRRGLPLHALLHPTHASPPVAVSAFVGAALDASLVDDVRAALARGHRTVKVKLHGGDELFAQEVEALLALRAAIPGAWGLRLDLNGAWATEQATAERFAALAQASAEFVEQPLAAGSLRALPIRWAADESLAIGADAERALELGATGGVVAVILKPAVLGLLGAWRLGVRAHRAGLGVVVTHLFDGPIALAASCELALALPAPWACGLDLHPGLAAWPAREIPQRAEPAWIRATQRAGHGIVAFGDRGAR